MIAIITDNPATGRLVAHVVGATGKCAGHMRGHGYIVTWALGPLLELAPPESYGKRRGAEIPFIPETFRFVQCDKAAARQLGVIRRVLAECESVIAATDASAEGELTFRRIYNFLGCDLPVKRLWISSLTEEAIERGMRELRDSSDFDRLWLAADCRTKADWLVGMNASNALARATGIPGSSLGRVQTPTLAIIASRYLAHRRFLSSKYWTFSVMLDRGGSLRRFQFADRITEQKEAEAIAARLKREATITKIDKRKRLTEAAIGDMRFHARYIRGFAVGDTLAVTGHSIAACRTLPEPLHTEATLLAAMEKLGFNYNRPFQLCGFSLSDVPKFIFFAVI